MADRAVYQTRKASDGDITHLCNANASWGPRSKADAISDIENGYHTYHVPWTTGRTNIEVIYDSTVSGGKYLRTDADSTTKNNLLDLPDC